MNATETQSMTEVARLLGRLLLLELDRETLARLVEPEVCAALIELGVKPPADLDSAALDELAAQFYSLVLQPADSRPLVQSLWTSGGYEGDAAVAVRALASAAGLELDKQGARGAPQDQLGALLTLWADTRSAVPAVADRIEAQHLRWALEPLAAIARQAGFYGGVAGATARWIQTVT